MPSFCRHGRFIERCPICSKTLPGVAPSGGGAPRAKRSGASHGASPARRRGAGVRIRREGRAEDDGYRSELVAGIRASADALRLVEEISFASGRLLALAAAPPSLYGEARALKDESLERASWMCFLTAYLSPLQGDDPFAAIESVLVQAPLLAPEDSMPTLEGIQTGPRTSHEQGRGVETLRAYRQWVERIGGGSQVAALTGDPAWSAERRFERLFERLALPGFGRTGRYELLLTLGRLACYEMRPDSLHLAGGRGEGATDPTTVAAKRVFGIGDQLLLDRRAGALAEAAGVPVEALDLALANWASPVRATVGFPVDARDDGAYERAGDALGL